MKHRIAFEAIYRFQWNTAKVTRSDRQGEVRYAAIGYIYTRLYLVAFTYRGQAIRVISIRCKRRS